MGQPGKLLIHLVAMCVMFWTAGSDCVDAQSVGQSAKPFLVLTIRPVMAPNYRPQGFGQEKIVGPQSFTTYPVGTFLQLGGPRDGTCGESKTPHPDQYCVNGKEADHGQFDDQFLVDKSAVETVDAFFDHQVQHFRANREVALYDIPWGHGPTLQSEIAQKKTKLAIGTDVSVSMVKGPYYRIDFLVGPNKSSAWAKSSDFDKADGPPPVDSTFSASVNVNSEDHETPEDFVSWMVKWTLIATAAVVAFCGWTFYSARGRSWRGQSP